MIEPGRMREIVRRHILLWKTASHAEWRACFTPGYQIEDPVGTGRRPMGSYEDEWENMHSKALRVDMEAYRLTVGGREVVADLRAVTHLPGEGAGPDARDGMRHTLSYTGIYTIDDDGMLCANRTFADPVSEALWQAFYPTLPPPSERPPPARTPEQLHQAVEDHLYFWNVGSHAQWRRRFREDALLEDPVGTGPRELGDARSLWEATHADTSRLRRGCHRVIVCGMEVLAHTVSVLEASGTVPRSFANTEILRFDDAGRVASWRVFRDEGEP